METTHLETSKSGGDEPCPATTHSSVSTVVSNAATNVPSVGAANCTAIFGCRTPEACGEVGHCLLYPCHIATPLTDEVSTLKQELAQARRQTEMDTECIERIRESGMQAELSLAQMTKERDKWKQWQEDTRQGGQILAAERDNLRTQLLASHVRMERMQLALNAVYNYNEAARSAVIQHCGIHHAQADTTLLDTVRQAISAALNGGCSQGHALRNPILLQLTNALSLLGRREKSSP